MSFFNILERFRSSRSEPIHAAPQGQHLSLVFDCVVQPGFGSFSRMVFPGRDEMSGASADWPKKLASGSLNCVITKFPKDFKQLAGKGDRIQSLDSGYFTPEFTIPAKAIKGNNIAPYSSGDDQRRGMAQVWRCAVLNKDTGENFDAWHVRRVDGTFEPYHGIIELMADRKLRTAHRLNDNTPIQITMFNKG